MLIFKKTKKSDLRHRIVWLGKLSHRRKTTSSMSEMIRRKKGKAFSKVHLYMPVRAERIFIRI